jgi:DDE superfamily endonuclease
MPTANAEVMSLHLAEISRNVAPGAHAALVLDGAGYHIAADLKLPPNITLVPLPRYAPELNPMENVWNTCAATSSPTPSSIATKTFSTRPATPGCSSKTTPNASPHQVNPVVRTTGTGILIGNSAAPFPSHS